MDIEEFSRSVTPRARRSRLDPFKKEILLLKERGFADWQVRDWLASNGLRVTRQAVQQFVHKHWNPGTTPLPEGQSLSQAAARPAPQAEQQVSGATRKIENPADIRKSRSREIDLDSYNEPKKE